jgi:hypothetical protein
MLSYVLLTLECLLPTLPAFYTPGIVFMLLILKETQIRVQRHSKKNRLFITKQSSRSGSFLYMALLWRGSDGMLRKARFC